MREPAEPSGSVPGSAIGGLTHLLWLVWTVGPLSLAPQVGHSRSGAVSSQVVSVDLYQSRRPVLNRPGMSGDSKPWEGWSHVWEHVEEVPA